MDIKKTIMSHEIEFTNRLVAMSWWNKLSLEEKFYKITPWLKSKNYDCTDRHPDSLTGKEIEEINKFELLLFVRNITLIK